MLYAKHYPVSEAHLLVHVHVPRTGGSTLRHQLHQMLGESRCLMNYRAEFEYLSDEELSGYRLISGHFSYGMHQYFPRQPLYITTVREPVERFVSLYAAFLVNSDNRHHAIAHQYEINQFLHYCLQSDDPELSQQVRNLQCRFVCGSEDFSLARTYIDQRYFLACPYNQTDVLARMLCELLQCDIPTMRIPNATRNNMGRYQDRMNLTNDSIALLLRHNAQDLQLYYYVQRAFAFIQDVARDEELPHLPATPGLLAAAPAPVASVVESQACLRQLMSNASIRVMQCLPLFLVRNMRALWIGPHDTVTMPQGVQFEVVADFEQLWQRKFAEGYFDLILVTLPFEEQQDDQQIFNRLHQSLSAKGILQICCLNPQRLLDWPDEYAGFSPCRTYQDEVLSHFATAEKKLLPLLLREKFPLTGSRCQVYLFFQDAQYMGLVEQCLSTLRPTLSVRNCASPS